MIVGATGCGKTAFINSLVNYHFGLTCDDDFRYIIALERDGKN
jgi:GTPase SAR1 family protein